jgi:hypothetical protein
MFELSDFYGYCKENNIDVIPYMGMPAMGATVRDGSDMAIFLDFSLIRGTRQLKGVCLHEQGHAATGALHKVTSPYETVERSEYRANRWCARHYLTAQEFQRAFSSGATQLWELSEYFDLPEGDVRKALTYWTESQGVDFNLDLPADEE